MKILLVEDEEFLREYIESILKESGFESIAFDSIKPVLAKKQFLTCDLIILDLVVKNSRGEDLIREVRKEKCNIPILVLSALGQISSKIDVLNIGADDYMVKPFDKEELLARINAIYRRNILKNNLKKDFEKDNKTFFYWKENKVVLNEGEILLSKKETELLYELFKRKGETVKNEDLLLKIWGGKLGYQSNVVQSTTRRLKNKWIKISKNYPIKNVHGVGYVYK